MAAIDLISDAFTSSEGSDTPGSEAPVKPADYTGMGALLEEPDEKKVAGQIAKWVQQRAPERKKRRTLSKRNKLWAKGVRGVRAKPVNEDMTEWELYVPFGALEMPPVMDRTEELVERTISHLLADKPIPDAEPADESDTAVEAADFTSRLLLVEGSESGFNLVRLFRKAEKKASYHGSGFIYLCVDPTGNGWRPMEIQAHRLAQTVQDATIDPLTQRTVATDDLLVTRYVREDDTLTDDPNEAKAQWLPKLRPEVLTDDHVVFLPETASGIEDADGVILIRWITVGDAKAKFPAFAELPDEKVRAMIGWSPDATARYADPSREGQKKSTTTSDGGPVPDDARFCTLSLYFKSHSAYKKGAYIVVAGGSTVLHKQPWTGMVERVGQGGVPRNEEECLEIPLVQVRQFDDDQDDDAFGLGMVAKLGPIDEVRGTIVLAWLEHLDQQMHRHTYLPLGSVVQPGQLANRDGTPIYFNPQGKPEFEQVPQFAPDGKEFFDRTTDAGNSATGLEQTAQAMDTPSVTSGVQTSMIVQQAAKNMATLRDNCADAIERFWRIACQQIRVFYTIPQQLKYEGEDGSWRQKEWSRVDLGSTRQIRIAAGSFTQQTPEQKEAMADKLLTAQVIDQQQYQQLISNNVRPKIGLKDNPFRLRVKKQVAKWKEGPPEGWMPPQPPVDPVTGQPAVDPMTGQPLPPPADPQDPFDLRPVDDDPQVAMIRYEVLKREMSEAGYGKQPPEWQQLFYAAFDRARRAAGVSTLAEQQQMQAQAQAQQQQAQAAEADKGRQHEKEKLQMQGGQKMQQMDAQHRQKQEMAEAERHAEQAMNPMAA